MASLQEIQSLLACRHRDLTLTLPVSISNGFAFLKFTSTISQMSIFPLEGQIHQVSTVFTLPSFEITTIFTSPYSYYFFQQKYQEERNEKGENGSEIEGVTSILSHTANLVELFHDKLVISSASDP